MCSRASDPRCVMSVVCAWVGADILSAQSLCFGSVTSWRKRRGTRTEVRKWSSLKQNRTNTHTQYISARQCPERYLSFVLSSILSLSLRIDQPRVGRQTCAKVRSRRAQTHRWVTHTHTFRKGVWTFAWSTTPLAGEKPLSFPFHSIYAWCKFTSSCFDKWDMNHQTGVMCFDKNWMLSPSVISTIFMFNGVYSTPKYPGFVKI